MPPVKLSTTVRHLNSAGIIDIAGEVTSQAEEPLSIAYTEATSDGARVVILNFSALDYMNSSGIGLLVTLLIRAQRQNLSLRAYGLSEHYMQIFALTRLDEAIAIFDDEAAALAGRR